MSEKKVLEVIQVENFLKYIRKSECGSVLFAMVWIFT